MVVWALGGSVYILFTSATHRKWECLLEPELSGEAQLLRAPELSLKVLLQLLTPKGHVKALVHQWLQSHEIFQPIFFSLWWSYTQLFSTKIKKTLPLLLCGSCFCGHLGPNNSLSFETSYLGNGKTSTKSIKHASGVLHHVSDFFLVSMVSVFIYYLFVLLPFRRGQD